MKRPISRVTAAGRTSSSTVRERIETNRHNCRLRGREDGAARRCMSAWDYAIGPEIIEEIIRFFDLSR
jgi:hypothetical protein